MPQNKPSSGKNYAVSYSQVIGDYFSLLKPRVMSLVIFTVLIVMVIAPRTISWLDSFYSLLCITIGAGAAGAINMWYETDIDKLMKRTRNRPLPQNRINRTGALIFGVTLALLSVFGLSYFSNQLAGFLLALTIFYYVVIYTMWLKPRTPQNIVIGGAAGALPVIVGWAAASGNISAISIILFLIIFLWTPPHFWALSLYSVQDYEAASIPMLPNVKGIEHTKTNILVYSVILLVVTTMPFIFNFTTGFYNLTTLILSIMFINYAYSLYKEKDAEVTKVKARGLFRFSLIYLFAIFLILLIDKTLVSFILSKISDTF